MGCASSKPGAEDTPTGAEGVQLDENKGDGAARPGSNAGSDTSQSERRDKRLSVSYQAKEMGVAGKGASRRESAPFDRAMIGVNTRHGVMPGPRNQANAKINQDRGVVCWPFAGTNNEAVLCIFDGHGSKGEQISDFCMTTMPALLEKEHDDLLKDPVACLTKNVCELDKIIFGGELRRVGMGGGTTSNVLYFKGDDVWVACSGDSRAIKGERKGGQIYAVDLSNDHKPDLPVEQERIERAGGVVSPAGANGSPARVWANGCVGLAMSRSIGDGNCKQFGVIPDPEVQHFKLKPPATEGGDGDVFIVAASDGVWEFIPSQEAATLVGKYENASEACEQLVNLAVRRWKVNEGNYRDDITCIVANLPFLSEDDSDPNYAQGGPTEAKGHAQTLNAGTEGITRLNSGELSDMIAAEGDGEDGDKKEEEDDEGSPSNNIIKRRLSVVNPYADDDDWEKDGA